MTTIPHRMLILAGAGLAALALAGCGASGPADGASPSSAASTAGAGGAAGDPGKGSASSGAIEVSGAWVPEPARPDVGAAYLSIDNTADSPDALVDVATTASEMAQIHMTETTGSGASTMREAEEIPVPAGGSAALEPGGYHIMIMDMSEKPAVGDTVTLTLEFDSGTEVEVDAPVLER